MSDLDVIRERHYPTVVLYRPGRPPQRYCHLDNQEWLCDAAILIARVDELEMARPAPETTIEWMRSYFPDICAQIEREAIAPYIARAHARPEPKP